MTLPSVILGILLSTLYGVVFHVWKGGGLGRLFLDIILSWIGFWLGHFIARGLDITIGSIGSLSLGAATAGSVLMLALGNWLSRSEQA